MAGTFALRYARAFANVAEAQHLNAGAAQEQMRRFAEALGESRPLREVMGNPSIPVEQKIRVLDALAERLGMVRQVRNFLAVMISHERVLDLNDVIAEYAAMADHDQGITDVEITTARPIEAAEREELEGTARELAGGPIRARYAEDASLLGGAVLKIGSTIYDGSLRARLAGMKQTLAGARLSEAAAG